MKETDTVTTETMRTPHALTNVTTQVLTKRGISAETCRKFNYSVANFTGQWAGKAVTDHPVQVAEYRNSSGEVQAHKLRGPDKQFTILGQGRNLGLWGQHLWRSGGKMVVVTEGEIDCLSVSQAQKNKWPVVSLPNGAPSAVKAVTAALEWLETFERVIFMFDMDEPGKAAARECAILMSPGKAFIAQLPMKDPNEMLVAGKSGDIVEATWGAASYRPDGIVPGEQLWEGVLENPGDAVTVSYPWMSLNERTMGMRLGEIVALGAGTGMGKSSVCREWIHWLITGGHTVGVLSLEENVRRTAQHLMALEMQIPARDWHSQGVEEEVKKDAFVKTVGSGRCFLYDHWGSTDPENLLNRIRFMVRGDGCKFVFLDHLSIVVSGLTGGDERRLIDNTMTRLRNLVEELEFHLVVVTHLKRLDAQSASHEEGGQVSLSHFRGSGAIAQLCDIAIGLERDQQSDSEADTTTLRVLKNRWVGDTGWAGKIKYDRRTGRLHAEDGLPAESPDEQF